MHSRKAVMTDRERVEALLRHEKPDRVPHWPFASTGFSVVYAKATIADAYNKPEVSLAAQRKACQDFGWVFAPRFGYAAYGAWEFGGDIKWPSGEFSQAPSVARHPVETLEDVENLKTPDLKTAGILPLKMEFDKLASQERLDNEPFNLEVRAGAPFTVAGNICGPENLARWIMKEPEAVHRLLRLATDHTLEAARDYRDIFGIEGVLPRGGEPTSSNDFISPKHFAEFAMPYLKEINEKILAMGYNHIHQHICGEHNLNLPYWAQIPFGNPGFISIGHEIELETAARYFPNDIIVGNLEPAIIQTRTPEEVYEATRVVIEKGKKCPGGFIFSPGCDLPPRADPECVMAITRALDDFGWYA